MDRIQELFQAVDLSSLGRSLLQLINTTDPCFVLLILGILTLLGSKMAAPYPALRGWGLRLAAATFLAYVGYGYVAQDGVGANQLPRLALRALTAAGLVLAPLWIVCPVLLFVYGRLRLALAAFLVYIGYAWLGSGGFTEEELFWVAVRGGIASGLSLVVAWILQPVTDFIAANFVAPLKERKLYRKADSGVATHLTSPQHIPNQSLTSHEAPPLAKLREQAEVLLDLNKSQMRQEAERLAAEKNRRRKRARLRAELCYLLHEQAIGMMFTRNMFETFVDRYLGDEQDPADVEEYAAELESIIQQHVNNSQPVMVQPLNLTDLNEWFLDEQRKIKSSDENQSHKKTKLVGLTRKYTQLAEQVIEEEEVALDSRY